MDEKQTRALNRLLKRLNAVRQTLRSDERGLLDAMVTQSYPEVEGHVYSFKHRSVKSETEEEMDKKGKPAAKPEVEGHILRKGPEPEVEGHAMKPKAKPKVKPEVEGHAMKPKAKPKTKPKTKA